MGLSGGKYERKIMGLHPYWIFVLAIGAFTGMRSMGGRLINWDYLGWEVVFPFYAAIMTGECVKTRSDPMFEVIEAQSESLFRWIFRRYLYVFVAIGAFAGLGILLGRAVNPGPSFGELGFVYLATAFFLSSFVILGSLFTKSAHMAVAAVGVYWLFSLLARSLLRFSFVAYIYPFLRFADESSPLWPLNQCILIGMGLAMWLAVFIVCKRRAVFTR